MLFFHRILFFYFSSSVVVEELLSSIAVRILMLSPGEEESFSEDFMNEISSFSCKMSNLVLSSLRDVG